ncbi:MAG: NAD(P)-binding domain-containing protein, partial [Betaproteobacteria bacterium]|nr:NAD(P)-binding domain-containing protein [Betaproteobacteria bacterium]
MSPGEGKYVVGFIGIGKMGLPMATRIATHGYPVHAYDASPAALQPLCAVSGVVAAKSLADVGRACAVVILMLPDSAVVKKVLYDASGGLAAHLKPGAIVVAL